LAANDEDPVVSSLDDYPEKMNASGYGMVPDPERALPEGREPAMAMLRQYL
jgi:hypothetical protein